MKTEVLGEDDSDNIVLSTETNTKKKVMIEEISSKTLPPKKKSISQGSTTEPEHRLFVDHDEFKRQKLIAEFYMPEIRAMSEVSVEANDDRLVVTSQKYGYAFDGFLPHKVDDKKTFAEYDNERMVNTQLMKFYLVLIIIIFYCRF